MLANEVVAATHDVAQDAKEDRKQGEGENRSAHVREFARSADQLHDAISFKKSQKLRQNHLKDILLYKMRWHKEEYWLEAGCSPVV